MNWSKNQQRPPLTTRSSCPRLDESASAMAASSILAARRRTFAMSSGGTRTGGIGQKWLAAGAKPTSELDAGARGRVDSRRDDDEPSRWARTGPFRSERLPPIPGLGRKQDLAALNDGVLPKPRISSQVLFACSICWSSLRGGIRREKEAAADERA